MVTITINERTKAGKSLVQFLTQLAETNKYVKVLTESDIERIEDARLGALMEKNRKGKTLTPKQQIAFEAELRRVAAK